MDALKGKVALVTGAARGIGAATAELFAAEGARVMVADLNETAGKALAASIANAAFVRLDVSDEKSWQAAVKATVDQFGQLDVLVNNAGIYTTSPIEDTPTDIFVRIFQVNQLGPFLGMRTVIPAMKANKVMGGSIVNLSSTSGFKGNQNSVAYGGTKWAVRGMTKVAAVELGQYGIRVNSVHPGLIDTPMNQEQMGDAVIKSSGQATPMGREGSAKEVAQLILFLASDAASYCSGGEYAVDGAVSAGTLRKKFVGAGALPGGAKI